MFSLKTVFVVTAVVALFVGIFTTGNAWLVSAFFAFALLLSLWAAMERKRPFWRGFAYFGVGYMLVTTIPAFSPIGGVLPTTMVLIPNMTELQTDGSDAVELVREVQSTHDQVLHDAFFIYGLLHAAIGMFIGLCAGVFCQWRSRKALQELTEKAISPLNVS